MATHKPFREIVPPNSNFEFVGNVKKWVTLSILLILGSIAMLFVNKSVRGDYLNWTIDFKGGTEIIVGFQKPSADGTAPEDVEVGAGDVRAALKDAGYTGFAVAGFSYTRPDESGEDVSVQGLKVALADFGAVTKEDQDRLNEAFKAQFADREVLKLYWSGDRIFVRSKQPLVWETARQFFAGQELELKPWEAEDATAFTAPKEGTGEFEAWLALRGTDARVEKLLEEKLDGVDVVVLQTYAVGARAGDKLRNDGIKSLFYAMALIMLYLAFRFDVRYAPGAVVALLHDAVLVIGVFAVTWQEVSLTTVAALLTVIGYSVNDSVVIFDRIRENVERLKDKKFSRIINISLNETMSRTLLTSITLFVVAFMMNVLAAGLVSNFAFALNVGVVVGVYSSVFIASPVALWIHNRWFSRQGAGGERIGKLATAEGPDVGADDGDRPEPGDGPKPKARRKKRRR